MVQFDQVLESLTIKDILEDAGLKVNRNRMACPIHDGDNPTSFSFTDSVFCCHSCGASGGMLALAAYLHNCSERDAMKKLYWLAGFPVPSDNAVPERQWLVPIPTKRPRVRHSGEYYETKNRLEWLELYQYGLDAALRILRRNIREGKVPLEEFYFKEQMYLYDLGELGPVVTELNSRANELKKKGNSDGSSAASSN